MDLARSEAYLRGALAQDPQFPDALFQLADVTLQRGNCVAGARLLERYLAAGKPTPAALWLGVRIEQALNEPAAAPVCRRSCARSSRSPRKPACCSRQSRSTG